MKSDSDEKLTATASECALCGQARRFGVHVSAITFLCQTCFVRFKTGSLTLADLDDARNERETQNAIFD